MKHVRKLRHEDVASCEQILRALPQWFALLHVKTVGPSSPDPSYAATRRFYAATGFKPLFESSTIWGEDPCLVMVKRLTTSA